MMSRFSCFFISWLLCAAASSFAQQRDTDFLLEKISDYSDNFPQEKVYLHLDKPYYGVGDDIWFKGYITIGPFNLLSGLSKILYVDLVDPKNQIMQSLRLPIIAGATMGDFQLADSLGEGNYRVRAYTNWMRNFDTDLFFDQPILIGNYVDDRIVTHTDFTFQNSETHIGSANIRLSDTDNRPISDLQVQYEVVLSGHEIKRGKAKTNDSGELIVDFVNKKPTDQTSGFIKLTVARKNEPTINKFIPIQTTALKNSIQFFPEGGPLVGGNISKVGISTLHPNGRGITANGIIIDQDGKEITAFETKHAGISSFIFMPDPNQSYSAYVNYENGQRDTVALPSVQTSGYGLALNNDNATQVFAQLYATPNLVAEQTITLLAQRNGAVVYAVKSPQRSTELLFTIPRDRLPTGVVQLTAFDEQMRPIAERSIFNLQALDFLPIAISTDKETYGRREEVKLTLEVGSSADTSRLAILSSAVVDVSIVPENLQSNATIFSELLLNTDLKGYLENPAHYFDELDTTNITLEASRRRALDNLMLTQSSRDIKWEDILAGKKPPATHQPEQDLQVSGIVTKSDGKTPVPNASVALFATTAGNVGIIDTLADESGRFTFDRLVFGDDAKFVVQARDERGRRNVKVILDENPKQVVSTNRNQPDAELSVNQAISSYLKRSGERLEELQRYGLRQRTILIEEVKVNADARESKVKHSSNLNGPGRADQIITADELLLGCFDLAMCLQGRLVGVIFRNGVPYSTRNAGGGPMQVILDGIFLEATDLSIINPFDIETIEVLRGPSTTSIYGMRGGNGVIIVTTKRGDSASLTSNVSTPGVVTYSPQGYYEVRDFYSPDYGVTDSLADMHDLRTTIHWEPHLTTDADGQATFSFYTADQPGRYRIVVEGLDGNGRLGREIKYITVN